MRDEELHDWQSSSDIVLLEKLAGHLIHLAEVSLECKIILGKTERKKPLGKPSLGLDNNIKIDVT